MRRSLNPRRNAAQLLLPLLLALAVASSMIDILDQPAFGQNVEGQIIASQYGQWQLQGTQTNSFVFSPAACQVKGGNQNFSALKQGVPIRVVDPGNSALDETLVAGLVNIQACSVQLLPVNVHNPPFYLTSGTAGLQEAINANQTGTGTNSIILSADWYNQGGSAAIIANVTGIPTLSLVDITTTPYTWYEWNGSQYTAVPVEGGGSPGGSLGAVQYNSGGSFAGEIITGIIKGNGTSAPSTAIPGTDYQAPLGFTPANVANNLSDLTSKSAARTTLGLGTSAQLATILNASPSTQLSASLVPTLNQNTTGNAATAAQLAATPTTCPSGQAPTGILSNGNATGCATAGGIGSINGSTSNSQSIVGSGIVSVTTVGSTTTVQASGGAGNGAVSTETQYADGGYQNAGTIIGSQGNSFTVPNNLNTSQMQSAVSGLSAGEVLHINGPEPPFTNAGGYEIEDQRPGVRVKYLTEYGAACDATTIYGTTTAGSNVLNGYGNVFLSSDAGTSTTAKWISIVYGPSITGGAPERFDAYVVTFTSASQVVLSANAPYSTGTNGNWTITYGHDDTTPIAEAMAASKGQFTVGVPSGPGYCWSRQNGIRLNGQSITGNGKANGGLLGSAGFDTLLADDPSETPGYSGQGTPGQDIGNFAIYFDARIDASLPWVFDNNGTITDETENYRPVGSNSAVANMPFGPGWIRGSEPFGLGAYGGVAAVTASSAVMCVLTGGTPGVGASIVFPYLTSVFQTTVASTAGSCGTGTPITLTAAPSQTVAQAEYYYGEAPGASGTGTAIQELATAIPATGRSYPMTIDLVNPIQPEPGQESDFAPFGMFKVDGEHFYYYGNSTYPAQSTPYVIVTSSLENGLSATGPAHAVDAAIVAVNPYQPTWPWVFAAIGGVPTPPNAEAFPAYNIGNCGFASPVYNGTDWTGSSTFYRARIHDLAINAWPVSVYNNTYENLTGYQEQNATCGMYFGGTIPFNTEFSSDIILNPFYGIVQGGPSTLTNNWVVNGYPTADQTNWHHIAINAAVDFDFIGGGTNSWNNLQLFSQSGGPLGPYQAYLTPQYLGATSAGMWTPGPGSDLDGLTPGQLLSSACHHSTMSNLYLEAESGANEENLPMWEDDCDNSNWKDQGDISGGTEFIGGHDSIYTGAFFSNGSNAPLIVDGQNISLQHAFTTNEGPLGNVFGVNSLLIWGTNDCAQSDLSIGGDDRISYGNCATPSIGQTQEFAELGNLAAPAVNSQSGWFPASAIGGIPDSGTIQTWTFDNTPANISQGYVGCNAGTVSLTQYCTMEFNGNTNVSPTVGPGQQLAAQKYIWTLGLRTSGGSAQTVSMYVSDCHGYIDTTHTAIPISSTWTNVQVGIIDFSASSGCSITFTVNGLSATAEQVQISYSSFVPLPQNFQAQQFTLPNGSSWTSGPSAPSGSCTSGALYTNTSGSPNTLYVCQASAWVGK